MRRSMDDERPQPDGDPEAPMDTGAPPGVHPNSDVPDPEVVEKSQERGVEPGDEEAPEEAV
jgi:hypothetical protein